MCSVGFLIDLVCLQTATCPLKPLTDILVYKPKAQSYCHMNNGYKLLYWNKPWMNR